MECWQFVKDLGKTSKNIKNLQKNDRYILCNSILNVKNMFEKTNNSN
jgi:hypothetical protein